MRRFLHEVLVHVRNFFTNWHEYDAPVTTKLRLTFRNRLHATFSRAQCCGITANPAADNSLPGARSGSEHHAHPS